MTPQRYRNALAEVEGYYRTAMRLHVGLALVAFTVGLVVALLAFFLGPEGSDVKLIESLGGLLVSSLAAFPIKELLTIRKKKISISSISNQLEEFVSRDTNSIDIASVEKLFNHILQFMS